MSTSHARKERKPSDPPVHGTKAPLPYDVEGWAGKTWKIVKPMAGVAIGDPVSITSTPAPSPKSGAFQITISVGSATDWQGINMPVTAGYSKASGKTKGMHPKGFDIASQVVGGKQQLDCTPGAGSSGGASWTAQEGG